MSLMRRQATTNVIDQDDLLVEAFGPVSTDEARRDAIWSQAMVRIDGATGMPSVPGARSARRGWRGLRVAVVTAAACVVLTGLAAAAAPDLASRLLGLRGPELDRMEVFQEPVAQDEVPAWALRQLEQLTEDVPGVPKANLAGSMVGTKQVRLLLDGEMAGVRIGMWGTPTSTSRACYVWLSGRAGQPFPARGGGGTCIGFRDGWPLSESDSFDGPNWFVMGGAADGVVAVRLTLEDGTKADALMGNNAFAWIGRDHDPLPVAIEVERVDGTFVRRPHNLAAYADEMLGRRAQR